MSGCIDDSERIGRPRALVSVVICTYNRCESLNRCLESLAQMRSPRDADWELLIVDNNSTDATRDVCEAWRHRLTVPFEYVFEETQGTGAARNKGIQAARGNIVAFTDDDCLVAPDWLENIVREFDGNPRLSGLGGRSEQADARDATLALRMSEERRVLCSATAALGFIPGCNMAFRRELLADIGGFDPFFGAGARFPGAEDTDFLYRAFKRGARLLYAPNVRVIHNHGRRSLEEVKNLRKNYVASRGAFYAKHALRGDTTVMRLMYWEIRGLIASFWRKALQRTPGGEDMWCLKVLAGGFLMGVREGVFRPRGDMFVVGGRA